MHRDYVEIKGNCPFKAYVPKKKFGLGREKTISVFLRLASMISRMSFWVYCFFYVIIASVKSFFYVKEKVDNLERRHGKYYVIKSREEYMKEFKNI